MRYLRKTCFFWFVYKITLDLFVALKFIFFLLNVCLQFLALLSILIPSYIFLLLIVQFILQYSVRIFDHPDLQIFFLFISVSQKKILPSEVFNIFLLNGKCYMCIPRVNVFLCQIFMSASRIVILVISKQTFSIRTL